MSSALAIDLLPSLRLVLLVCVIALLPLSYVWLRSSRGSSSKAGSRLSLLTAVTLFLTFDLIVFGAFTRLSDSGLGCPDWPGCYGQASPMGAQTDIDAAQAALPAGPVTTTKAWIEMIHRYLAMTVGALVAAIAAASWRGRRDAGASVWLPTLTLVWVIVQGLFGKYTVTLKLYPAVVSLHLLGGMLLLALLVVLRERLRAKPIDVDRSLRRFAGLCLLLLVVQLALGAWVSSNYAVLACTGFPTCNGSWWPAMDASRGFTFLRGLGEAGANGHLTFDALVAIHMAHRICAVVVVLALMILSWRLWQVCGDAPRRFGLALALIVLAQVATGLSTVVLGWPLIAALAHSAGAAALVFTLTTLLARSSLARSSPDRLSLRAA